jgi:hypothetical protein
VGCRLPWGGLGAPLLLLLLLWLPQQLLDLGLLGLLLLLLLWLPQQLLDLGLLLGLLLGPLSRHKGRLTGA